MMNIAITTPLIVISTMNIILKKENNSIRSKQFFTVFKDILYIELLNALIILMKKN